MLDDDLDLKSLSNKKLEGSSEHGESDSAFAAESQQDVSYEGPEKRSGKERRVTWDRRFMVRFEPNKEKHNRRSGKDRRKENQKPEGHWDL